MAMYDRMMYNGYRVYVDTSKNGAYKLKGLRDTIIYVTHHANIRMSYAFEQTCLERNIEVKVIPGGTRCL